MSDVNVRKRKNKKWIVKALVIFLIIMGILTFFSNTIMNMTLTQVSTQQIYGATLSSITRASGTVRANTEKEVKAPGNITVKDIGVYLYGMVEAGDSIATFDLPEEKEDLETAKKNLENLEKEMEYAERKPSESSDFYTQEMAVVDAEKAVTEAEKVLEAAKNKDAAISETEDQIKSLQDTITQLEKDKADLESKKMDAENKSSSLYEQIEPCQVALADAQEMLAACITDPEDPEFSQEVLDACNQAVTDAQQALDNAQAAYDQSISDISTYGQAIIDKDTAIENKNSELLEKQTDLETFKAISSVSDAERALSDAKHNLTVAKKDLSDARTNAGITSDQNKDEWEGKLKQKEEYEKEIARLEEYYAMTDVKAPITGMVTAINVSRSMECMKDQVMFTIADINSGYYVECSVPKKDAESMFIGSEVKTDYCDSAVVESICPDPADHLGDRNSQFLLPVPFNTNPEDISHYLVASFQEQLHVFPGQPLQILFLFLLRVVKPGKARFQLRRVKQAAPHLILLLTGKVLRPPVEFPGPALDDGEIKNTSVLFLFLAYKQQFPFDLPASGAGFQSFFQNLFPFRIAGYSLGFPDPLFRLFVPGFLLLCFQLRTAVRAESHFFAFNGFTALCAFHTHLFSPLQGFHSLISICHPGQKSNKSKVLFKLIQLNCSLLSTLSL